MNRKKLNSKRNKVYLVESNLTKLIEKYYENADDFKCELKFYQENQLENVPLLIDFNETKKMIKISFIKGASFADYLVSLENRGEFEASVTLMIHLFEWMDRFHYASEKKGVYQVMRDVNLSNFIVSDEIIYGIDFEQICIGNPLSDIAQIIVIYMNNKPENTPFKQRVYERLKGACQRRYHIDEANWNKYIEKAKRDMNQRRQMWGHIRKDGL